MPGPNFTLQQAKKALWFTYAVWRKPLQDELNIFL
jgi:hypothetical protein